MYAGNTGERTLAKNAKEAFCTRHKLNHTVYGLIEVYVICQDFFSLSFLFSFLFFLLTFLSLKDQVHRLFNINMRRIFAT